MCQFRLDAKVYAWSLLIKRKDLFNLKKIEKINMFLPDTNLFMFFLQCHQYKYFYM